MGSISLRVISIHTLLILGFVSVSSGATYHESKLVPVEWKSVTKSDQQSEENLYKVAKPEVSDTADEQPLVHRVFQAPSVYNQPAPVQPSNNKFVEGFRRAGQDIGNTTSQSFRDLGNGVHDAAQGALDGTRDFLSASGKAVGDVADNTINIANDEYWEQKRREQAAAQNQGVVPPASFNEPVTTTSVNQPLNSQFVNNNNFNNRPNNTQPVTNQSVPSEYNSSGFNSSANFNNQTAPAVPREDPGIATSFSNNNSNAGSGYPQDSRMESVQFNNAPNNAQQAPPLRQPNNGYQGNYNNNGQFANQNNGGYFNNGNQNNGGFQNPNAPLIQPPNTSQYAGNNNIPNWSTPPVQNVSTQTNNTQPPYNPGYNNQQNNSVATNTNANGTVGWGENTNPQTNNVSSNERDTIDNRPDPLGRMGMLVVLAASLAGNIYGWTACLDLRNKYRASLRRQPS